MLYQKRAEGAKHVVRPAVCSPSQTLTSALQENYLNHLSSAGIFDLPSREKSLKIAGVR